MSPQRFALVVVLGMLLAMPTFAQQKGNSSPCGAEYENHNQTDYGPLVVRAVKGAITDDKKVAVPGACLAIFTEDGKKRIATTISDSGGRFSLEGLASGNYRLIVRADPLCAANVPLQVVKNQKKMQYLQVHMKPRGLDSCSFADLGNESVEKR